MAAKGFDKLSRTLNDAQDALADLDGELGVLEFNPHDPGSIENAIAQMEQMIDEKLGRYASNPIIGPMSESMKEQYRAAFLEKAAAARSGEGQDGDA